jgi:glycosyltransferase involved in cell wall biosynthesis
LQKEAPDVINSQWANDDLIEVATDLGIPTLNTIHNMYVWLDPEGWNAEKKRSLYYTRAIAVSDLVRRYYIRWNNIFRGEWISVVNNAIDPKRLHLVKREQARQAFEIPDDAILFLSMASYDGRKNQLGMLTAFDEIGRCYPEAHLLCAGNVADPKYTARLRDYHATLPTKERIHLLDYQQDTGTLLSAADCFLIDSFYEGWSLAATEALVAGIPLIHSECGSARELVGKNEERGIVIPNPACEPIDLTWEVIKMTMDQKYQRNTSDLVNAMTQMIENQHQWHARKEQIRTEALQEFDIERTFHRYSQLIWSIFDRQAPERQESNLHK